MTLCAIIAGTTAIGVLLSADKKRRAGVYEELYEFNERMLINLRYGGRRVGEISSGCKYMADILAGKSVLGGEDDRFLREYSKSLGVSDSSSQIDYLVERRPQIKKLRDESAENYKKYSSMYIKIALMAGVLIAVLLA